MKSAWQTSNGLPPSPEVNGAEERMREPRNLSRSDGSKPANLRQTELFTRAGPIEVLKNTTNARIRTFVRSDASRRQKGKPT